MNQNFKDNFYDVHEGIKNKKVFLPTNGAFPPNSKLIRLTVPAACEYNSFPTSVLPVKDIFLTSGFVANSVPTCFVFSRLLVTTLNTPFGTPACSAISASAQLFEEQKKIVLPLC